MPVNPLKSRIMGNLVEYGEIELREGTGTLSATILTEGRAANSLRELFLLGACTWPTDGVLLRAAHLRDEGSQIVFPTRHNNEIHVNCTPTPEIRAAVENGARFMSVEFHALAETRTESGIREIARAMIVGAATVRNPVYKSTRAELRERREIDRYLLWV